MIKFKLRKGHKELFGEDTLFTHRKAAERLEKYMHHNGLMIDLRHKPYNNMTSELANKINKRRDDLIGNYLDTIDPNYIVNMNWISKGELGAIRRRNDPKLLNITIPSIKKWGIFVPIIVGALPEWHPYWVRPTKFYNIYDSRCSFIIEGRHRTYIAITIGLTQMKAFVLDPVKVED